MTPDSEQKYEANWGRIHLILTQEEYDTAMSHVEMMRHTAEEENAYGGLDEEDEDYMDPEGWKLSDTLATALEEGKRSQDEGQKPKQELILEGLRLLDDECDLDSHGPCMDPDADDVFQA
jgi:hypothetical protein